ncbi:MAG: hypothetical protein GY811_07445, partial [Myxococcales bacterium]|nr:hypothetical protein [Myxococcales bacterium]
MLLLKPPFHTRARYIALSALTICASLSIPSQTTYSQETHPKAGAARVSGLRAALATSIGARVKARQRALGDEVRIGIAVVDGETGEVLYEKSADEAFVAASNAKLITTAAAL